MLDFSHWSFYQWNAISNLDNWFIWPRGLVFPHTWKDEGTSFFTDTTNETGYFTLVLTVQSEGTSSEISDDELNRKGRETTTPPQSWTQPYVVLVLYLKQHNSVTLNLNKQSWPFVSVRTDCMCGLSLLDLRLLTAFIPIIGSDRRPLRITCRDITSQRVGSV